MPSRQQAHRSQASDTTSSASVAASETATLTSASETKASAPDDAETSRLQANLKRPRVIRRRPESVPTAHVRVSLELQCQYKGKLCRNERTFKEDGERHSLCELHRQRANANQRRWQKKHQHKVRRRHAAAAEAMPYARPGQSDHAPLDDEADDWIDPLFDHLIARMGAEHATEARPVPQYHVDRA